jgi:EAL domain-containing protein (putative c-di-GMP-specific phosphodiesterase class I)
MRLSASLGVAAVREEVLTIDEILDVTRQALAAGKREGKNRVVAVTDAAGRRRMPAVTVDEEYVRRMTEDGAVRPFVQTIRDLASRRVVGHELLSRGPHGPYQEPADFFRLSREKRMLTAVDLACLRTCIAAATQLPPGGSIHVNIFPSTLLDSSTESLIEFLHAQGCEDRFCLEISEQQFLGVPKHLVEAVRALQQAGVRVGIDDVGFGKSSLEALVVLEPDVIKVARECVAGADGDPTRRRGLERLVRASHALCSQIVAEGVETEAERQILLELGIELAQGFLWDRPVALKRA